ncbi:MAG: anti-sigma factor family protein [Cellulosilyticaceae bacterium]
MNCEKCLENLSAYIDHALSSSELDAVAKHLDECPVCQEEYLQLVQILSMVSDMEVYVPAGFHEALMTRIKEEKNVASSTNDSGKVIRLQSRRWGYWAGGAAAALILGMSWMLQPHDGGQMPIPVATKQQQSRGVPTQVSDEASPMMLEAGPMAAIASEEWNVDSTDLPALVTVLEKKGYKIQQTDLPGETQLLVSDVTDKVLLEAILNELNVTIQVKRPSEVESVTLFIKK